MPMLQVLHNTKIDFIKSWRIAVAITALFIVGGLAFLGIHGVNRSIEFTGGTFMQVQFTKTVPGVGDIRADVDAAGYKGAEIQQFGSARDFSIRAAGHGNVAIEDVAKNIQAGLKQKFGADNVSVPATESISARVGNELTRNAIVAILISFAVT